MIQRAGGIVLCGGQSRRMGMPKAWLPFGGQTLLQRVVSILQDVVDPVVVVAGPDQALPTLPEEVVIARDTVQGLGPLAGLTTGLEVLAKQVDMAYVSSCDVPLLRTSFVAAVIDRLNDADVAIGRDATFYHPLAAVYRTALAPRSRELIAQHMRRPLDLIRTSRTNLFDVDELRTVDPELHSLRNANTPQEYAELLKLCGVE